MERYVLVLVCMCMFGLMLSDTVRISNRFNAQNQTTCTTALFLHDHLSQTGY